MSTSKFEDAILYKEQGSNDKSEQKYGGNITKGRKGCLFGVVTLVLK